MARILVNMPSQSANTPAGVAKLCFSLLEALIESGRHDYVLRSPWPREQLPPTLAASAIEIVRVRRWKRMVLNVLYQCVAMPLRTRASKIDLVLNVDPFGASTGAKGRRITLLNDLYLHAIRQQFGARASFTTDICYRLTLGQSARIVTISEATRADALRYYPHLADRISTIHCDSTLKADPAARLPREIAEPYILIVGNATANKNYPAVAQAISAVPDAIRPTLVHVGLDLGGAVEAACRRTGGVTYRSFTNVDEPRLAGFYQNAICLCVSSTYEGFCLPIVEAQHLGCPVVSSDRSVMPEVAGEGAWFYDPDCIEGLTGLLVRAIEQPSRRAELIERGHLNRARFSWRLAAKQYEDLFADLLARQ